MASSSFVDGANHLIVKEQNWEWCVIAHLTFIGEENWKYLCVAEGSTREQAVREFVEILANGFAGSSIKKLIWVCSRDIVWVCSRDKPSLAVHCSNLQELAFRWTPLGTDGAAALARVLPAMTTLVCLELIGHVVCNDEVLSLVDCLPQTNIKELNFNNNRIALNGIAALAGCLPNTTIQKLDLPATWLGNDGVIVLANCLPQTNIKELSLESNSISANGVAALAGCLPNTTIQNLKLSWNPIGDDGAIALANCLLHTKIQRLDLNENRILDDGGAALVNCLKENVCLQHLDCKYNPFYDNNKYNPFEQKIKLYTKLNKDHPFQG